MDRCEGRVDYECGKDINTNLEEPQVDPLTNSKEIGTPAEVQVQVLQTVKNHQHLK